MNRFDWLVADLWMIATHPVGSASTFRTGLKLDRDAFRCLAFYRQNYLREFFPPDGVKGKTILHIGAACGEIIYLFFKAGAQRVIAIEPDENKCKMLADNSSRFAWNVDLIKRKFQVSDLDIPHDFCTMNIEGYELLLLEYGKKLGRMTVDAHNWYVVEKLTGLGFHPITVPDAMEGHCRMANWEKEG